MLQTRIEQGRHPEGGDHFQKGLVFRLELLTRSEGGSGGVRLKGLTQKLNV